MSLYEYDQNERVKKESYLRIQKELAKILRRDADEAEREELAMEDWLYDTNNTEILTKPSLFNSLFEMADMWTPNISAME